MSDTNPFKIIFAVTAIVIIISGITAIVAPAFGFGDAPTQPSFPSWASGLNWTFTLTNWSGIASTFILIGGVIWYFLLYLTWMVSVVTFFFTILGAAPIIAYGITGLISVLFIGSLLMFIRSSGGGQK